MLVLLLPARIAFAAPAAAQTVPQRPPIDTAVVAGTDVQPDTVTVGGRFRAAVFVRAPAGSRVELVVAPAPDGTYQTVDSVRAHPPDSAGLVRAVAPMVLWVTGPAAFARAEARVTLPDGRAQALPVQLPFPSVRPVLPADSAAPRPPRDILPAPRRSWPWAWIAAGVLALAALAWGWMRRRRRPRSAAPLDPRQHALAALDRLRGAESSTVQPGDVEAFSAALSAILREFAAAADPRLGTHLTTAELLDHLRRTGARDQDLDAIAGTLMHADLVKFARRRPTPQGALDDWAAARRWVQTFRADVPEAADAPALAHTGAGR